MRIAHTWDVLRRPTHLPGLRAKVAWIYWRHVRRYDSEVCHRCGRPVARGIGTWWHAPDWLWAMTSGPFNILCPACFVERALSEWEFATIDDEPVRLLVYFTATPEVHP